VFGHTRDEGGREVLGSFTRAVLFAGSAIRPAVESFESVILGVGDDVIQSFNTQLQPRVRSNEKSGLADFKILISDLQY